METMNSSIFVVALSLGLGACASSTGGSEATAISREASSIAAAASAHSDAMASVSGMAACESERDRYGAQVGPMLDSLESAAQDMDTCMASGGNSSPSMSAVCVRMRSELARHMGAACASAMMSDDAAEAALHASRMMGWAMTESDAANGMQGMMGGGMMGKGGCGM